MDLGSQSATTNSVGRMLSDVDDRETAKVPRRAATDSSLRQPGKDFAAGHYAIQPELANGIDCQEFPLCKIRSPVFRQLARLVTLFHTPILLTSVTEDPKRAALAIGVLL